MKIFFTGGSGFVGRYLTDHFIEQGHHVTVLTRNVPIAGRPRHGLSHVAGDPSSEGDWQLEVEGHDAVVNLAGAGIFKRWSRDYKETILRSRIDTTRNLTAAVGRAGGSVKVLLSASAVGYYGFGAEEELDEDADAGNDFLASVCRRWEEEARRSEEFGTRVVLCRLGIVLGRGGGALAEMLPLYRWRAGSRLGSGENWFSWIHMEDLAAAFQLAAEDIEINGPVNITSPEPVRHKDFGESLSMALGRAQLTPPVPAFIVKLLLGEFGSVLLEGQKVYPRVLLGRGFRFRFPGISRALEDLVGLPAATVQRGRS